MHEGSGVGESGAPPKAHSRSLIILPKVPKVKPIGWRFQTAHRWLAARERPDDGKSFLSADRFFVVALRKSERSEAGGGVGGGKPDGVILGFDCMAFLPRVLARLSCDFVNSEPFWTGAGRISRNDEASAPKTALKNVGF